MKCLKDRQKNFLEVLFKYMKVNSSNITYKSGTKNYKYQNFTGLFSYKNLNNIFSRNKQTLQKNLTAIRRVKPGVYGTECAGSIALSDFEKQFTPEELTKIHNKGLSTNIDAWADALLKSSADNPLSTSSVYDCSVLYAFNDKKNTHFLYHSYFDVGRDFFESILKTFMPENYSKACIIAGDSNWWERHSQTIPQMFKALKGLNKNAIVNVFHVNSELPEIVGYKGSVFEIPNRRTALGLSDKGQASFEICDIKSNNILGQINYQAITSKKTELLRKYFEEQNFDKEILKILNKLLDERLIKIKRIEACKTLEELNRLINDKETFNQLQFLNAFNIQKQKILTALQGKGKSP